MFKQVTILGLGLIGGSLGMALRRQGVAAKVIAWGRNATSLQQGVELGACDAYELDLASALAGADCVVVAAPVLTTEGLLRQVLEQVSAQTIVTDVASVKGGLAKALRNGSGELAANLVLAHPIAGSEKSGVAAAIPTLFEKHLVVLTPTDEGHDAYYDKVSQMWKACGAEVVTMSPERHDAVFAATSHLPHLLAYALVLALANSDEVDDIFRFAAGGFRDFSRIAASDPQMWTDIAVANKDELLSWLVRFQQILNRMEEALLADEAQSLKAMFAEAKSARDRFSDILAARGQDDS